MVIERTFDSSQVKRIQYNDQTKVMRITFKSGATFDYADVPESVWEAAKEADSIGSFVSTNIKGTYTYTKVG